MESVDGVSRIKTKITKRIQGLIEKKYQFLTPEDFLLFVDISEYYGEGYEVYEALIIKKVEEFPKDIKHKFAHRVFFLKKENYYFGDFLYCSNNTKEVKKLNKDGRRTLFLSVEYDQEKITNVYKEIKLKLPCFDIIVLDRSPEENEFALQEFYEDNESSLFCDFVFCNYCSGRCDKAFSAMILDENKNLIYNREMYFESEEDYELREFIRSDFTVKPKDIDISKRVRVCKYWINNTEDTNENVKAVLYQINSDYSWSMLKTFTNQKYDKI